MLGGRGGHMMQHGERGHRVKRPIRVGHPRGAPGIYGDVVTGVTFGQQGGRVVVRFQGGQLRDMFGQPAGGCPWAGADLQHVLAKLDPGGHCRQDLRLQVAGPLRAGAQVLVFWIHTPDATSRAP